MFDERTRTFRRHSALERHADLKYRNGIESTSVWSMVNDGQNNLWIGTYFEGIYCFDPAHNSYRKYIVSADAHDGLSSPIVSGITEDENGDLYIATEAGGFCHYDRTTGRYRQVRTLSNSGVGGVIPTTTSRIFTTTSAVGRFGSGLIWADFSVTTPDRAACGNTCCRHTPRKMPCRRSCGRLSPGKTGCCWPHTPECGVSPPTQNVSSGFPEPITRALSANSASRRRATNFGSPGSNHCSIATISPNSGCLPTGSGAKIHSRATFRPHISTKTRRDVSGSARKTTESISSTPKKIGSNT